jgi:hypothetical protein
MNNGYESIIHQIDKIFWKTSEANTDKKYKEVMKNPDKLILKLEQLYEKDRENGKQKKVKYT